MSAHRLIDKLSSVEAASMTNRVRNAAKVNYTANFINNSNSSNNIDKQHDANKAGIGNSCSNSSNSDHHNNTHSVISNQEEMLSEEAQTLPQHIILKTDFHKLNAQTPFFRCPEWADLPPIAFHLRCTRDGVVLPSFGLHRYAFYLFGKNAAVCDYILQHPSVSSVHAAFVFHREHECFVLVDLHSTNGVRVNNTRVPSQKPVPIPVGSVIQFGYSTRLYELRSGYASSSSSSFPSSVSSASAVANQTTHELTRGSVNDTNKVVVLPKRPRESINNDGDMQEQPQEQQHRYSQQPEVESISTAQETHKKNCNNVTESIPDSSHNNHKDEGITIGIRKDKETGEEQEEEEQHINTEPAFKKLTAEAQLSMSAKDHISVTDDNCSSNKKQQTTIDNTNTVMNKVDNLQESVCSAHLYQLVIKHKDVENPISRGAHNKGEVITRSKEDARALAMHILCSHDKKTTNNLQTPSPSSSSAAAALAKTTTTTMNSSRRKEIFVPWTVEEFVQAVLTYCEVSSAKKKGNLGVVTKGTFTEDFDKVAFTLRRNEVGGPVETQLGFHIIFRSD